MTFFFILRFMYKYVFDNNYFSYSSEKYWHEPKKFNPTRFLEHNSSLMFPFGSGPRTCIGQNFAMLEAKIMLAMLLQRFRFELVPGQKLVQSTAVTIRFVYALVNIKVYIFIVYFRPKYGLSMRVWPR
ncbi:MAG: cytochrome P450 [Bacteroidia bacterium]|nr:cytochrome P450 [Bacteroidia bacterium]